MMKKHFVKTTLTRCIAQSHKNVSYSTSSDLSATALLHPTPQPQTSTSLEIPSTTPPIKKRGRRIAFWLLAGTATFGIGDYYNRKGKAMFIEDLESRRKSLALEPRKLNTMEDVDNLGYQRVVCKGIFDKQRSIRVRPKRRSTENGYEKGYYVVTPLLPIPNDPDSMKSPILVNRGWVPLEWEENTTQLNLLTKLWYKFTNQTNFKETRHVEVVGLVRQSETPGCRSIMYPGWHAWFFLDVPKTAQAMGFGEDTIVYVEQTHKDMDESSPYPVPRDVMEMIHSKDSPMHVDHMFINALYSYCISLFCFTKAKWKLVKKYELFKKIPVVRGGITTIILKLSDFRDIFLMMDTKFNKKKKDQINDSIDLIQDLFDSTLNEALAFGELKEDMNVNGKL